MRIVHLVCSDRFAGVERYLTYVGSVLAERGHEVVVVGGAPERMQPAFAGTGVQFAPARTPVDGWRALARLRGRVDLLHVHMTDAELVGVTSRPLLRVPVVATLHFARHRGSSRPRRMMADVVARGLAAQVAISGFVADRAGVPGAVVVPNGVPWSEPSAPRQQVVLAAQRLEQEKDSATAIRAWAESGLGSSGWRFVMAGEGSERSRLEALSRDLAVGDSVSFVGNVDDLAGRMASAGLFLATAPDEPFGLSVVEAMAAGLPVVAAAGGAHLETVGLAGTDTLFAPGDATAAGTVLRRLADDAARRDEIGIDLQSIYRANFTIDRHVDRLLAVYATVG